MKILIVEDDKAVREIIVSMLETLGYDVTESSGVEDALAQSARDRFDLIITDIIMPGRNGISLAEQVKNSGTGVPVLAISGCISNTFGDALNLDGFFTGDVLYKPFTEEELSAAIKKLLPGAKVSSSNAA